EMLPDRSCTSGRGKCRPPPVRKALKMLPISRLWSFVVKNCAPEGRQGRPVITAEVEALAAIGQRPDQNSLLRPEVIAGVGFGQLPVDVAVDGHEIEDGGCEMADFVALLASD